MQFEFDRQVSLGYRLIVLVDQLTCGRVYLYRRLGDVADTGKVEHRVDHHFQVTDRAQASQGNDCREQWPLCRKPECIDGFQAITAVSIADDICQVGVQFCFQSIAACIAFRDQFEIQVVDADVFQLNLGVANEAIDEGVVENLHQWFGLSAIHTVLHGRDEVAVVGQLGTDIEGSVSELFQCFLGSNLDDTRQAVDLCIERSLLEVAAGE